MPFASNLVKKDLESAVRILRELHPHVPVPKGVMKEFEEGKRLYFIDWQNQEIVFRNREALRLLTGTNTTLENC